jgi:hypothetical protein
MRITVLEPGSRATNVVEVVVHRRDGVKLGMEFVESVPQISGIGSRMLKTWQV